MNSAMHFPKILVTGGAGFIGSHAGVALIAAGYTPLVLDSLAKGSAQALERVAEITGFAPALAIFDIRERAALDALFEAHARSGVLHLAGLKAVREAVTDPLSYYDVNVACSIALVRAIESAEVRSLIFLSSATVYGNAACSPIAEDAPLTALNPYGRTKAMVEEILTDVVQADDRWHVACPGFFNPVGVHASRLIGAHLKGLPHLAPYLLQAAIGSRPHLVMHGADYATADGTGVRDYVHGMDVAEGRMAALHHVWREPGILLVNAGTGRGGVAAGGDFILRARQRWPHCCTRLATPARRCNRVLGRCQLCASSARLGLSPRLNGMCVDSWRWQIRNPKGLIAPPPQQCPAYPLTEPERFHSRGCCHVNTAPSTFQAIAIRTDPVMAPGLLGWDWSIHRVAMARFLGRAGARTGARPSGGRR